MSHILLTGGTGTLGSHVLPLLNKAGQQVRVLSRRTHPTNTDTEFVVGDLTSGAGISAAVDGIDTIVHCAGSSHGDHKKTHVLLDAARHARVGHIVFISVVGVDKPTYRYYASKRAAEQVIAESGIPWTTLRATQFHDLILKIIRPLSIFPIVPVPAGFRFQPIDVNDVAQRLADIAVDEPSGLLPDIGGPHIHTIEELVHTYARVTQRRRFVAPLWIPGKAARTFRSGVNLAPNHAVGHRTWEQFLTNTVAATVD